MQIHWLRVICNLDVGTGCSHKGGDFILSHVLQLVLVREKKITDLDLENDTLIQDQNFIRNGNTNVSAPLEIRDDIFLEVLSMCGVNG